MGSDTVASRITTAVRAAAHAHDGLAVAAALNSIEPGELAEFFHHQLEVDPDREPVASGLPASPGAASGRIVLTADEACAAQERGENVILVRSETTPDDVLGMQAAKAIVTCRGGMVSHAAVVARGWGVPAVVGVNDLRIADGSIRFGTQTFAVGDEITIDGSTGNIYAGALATAGSEPPAELKTLLAWADEVAAGHVQVRANADTEGAARHGRDMGAQGIGLCRTEHMFLAADRLPIMRRFILADGDEVAEQAALAELEQAQVTDFEAVLEVMDGLPVTVRLLDPPLHEFLPDMIDLVTRYARDELTESGREELLAVRRLHESNPMIGTRGVRLGVLRPGLYEMQVKALCTATARLLARGKHPRVEIMIPLVVDAAELRIARGWVQGVLTEMGHAELSATAVTIGAMIETPRAALTSGALAEHADFFSFGTNDLTQLTYGFSRDDVEARLLPAYQRLKILEANPFSVLDEEGVGALVRMGCESARHAKQGIKLGVCGEHAGDPSSVQFLVRQGVDSVSCSPFRVPLARLGVAQALLTSGRAKITNVEFTYPCADDEDPCGDDETPAPAAVESTDSEPEESLIMHILRLRGFVTPAGFIASVGSYPQAMLAALVDAGEVRHIPARDMFSLTPAGKARYEALPIVAITDTFHNEYQNFLVLNSDFKQLCTDWQVRNGGPNDHSDAAYDQDCIQRLDQIGGDAAPIIQRMAEVVPRMTRYIGRLSEAASAVHAGDPKRFTGVMCESFHDVWMELHEDLIVMQRIDRVKEGSF